MRLAGTAGQCWHMRDLPCAPEPCGSGLGEPGLTLRCPMVGTWPTLARILAALKRDGWIETRRSGSHRVLVKGDQQRICEFLRFAIWPLHRELALDRHGTVVPIELQLHWVLADRDLQEDRIVERHHCQLALGLGSMPCARITRCWCDRVPRISDGS
jgi:hypothetical protein